MKASVEQVGSVGRRPGLHAFRTRASALCLLSLLLAGGGLPLHAQGHRITGDQVLVDRGSHWRAWTLPTHLVRVETNGWVRARDFRSVHSMLQEESFSRPVSLTQKTARISNIDSTVSRDIAGAIVKDRDGKFVYDYTVRPGVSRAGSNDHLKEDITDGDLTTYWEPNLDDPPENWWVEIDLGWVVPLERLRLTFVDESLGDPFYRYILLLGPNQGPYYPNDPTPLETFVPFEGANTDKREFVFDAAQVSEDLPPDALSQESRRFPDEIEPSPEWTGKLMHVVRILVTDTRGGRAEEVSQEEWQDLPDSRRGDIVYFLKDGDFEEPVDEETYNELPEDRRGRQVYYRRELPRLAEVEAWGRGDDIGVSFLEGGGTVSGTGDPLLLFDGLSRPGFSMSTFLPNHPDQHRVTIDLGGTVWLDELRMVSGPGERERSRGYLIRSSNGARDPQGNLQWQQISPVERENNFEQGYYARTADLMDPPPRARFLDFITLAHDEDRAEHGFWSRARPPSIGIMWLFSSAPTAEAVLESDLIELPGTFTLGAVRWEADAPPGSEVEIRTRTGAQKVEVTTYCNTRGNCGLTAKAYDGLPKSLKGPIQVSNVVGPGWSPWSRKYERSGETATSPGLRRFMQFQVRLINHDGQAVPSVRRLSIDLRTPLAQRLGAEVWPDLARPGRLDTFEVFVQPDFVVQTFDDDEPSPGFDEVLVLANPALALLVVDVAVGTESELGAGEPELIFDRPHADGLQDADGQMLQVTSVADSLMLHLPEVALQNSVEATVLPRQYFRILEPGDEVPTTLDGRLLSVHSYAQLVAEERGATRYFQIASDGTLEEVDDAAAYEELPEEEQGPVRYFRIVTGLGEQTVFNDRGDTLSRTGHVRLRDQRGPIVGPGKLLRLRVAAALYGPSTQLRVAVRNSTVDAPWQQAGEGDVTALRPASSLVIFAEDTGKLIDDIAIAPNPFTPNNDGVNDAAQIRFSLFKVSTTRAVAVRLYTLAGDPVRHLEIETVSGEQEIAWDGRDDGGNLVPPGLYLCQIDVSADAAEGSRKSSRVIAVAY